MKVTVERELAGRTLSITSGELAKQSSGAVLVQYGETVLFVAVQTGPSREGTDFFPLTVDYRERLAAAGKFAGGFLKREGRPTTREILTCRLTDRPIRPLFPDGFRDEVQVCANVLACDGENEPDVLTTIGASAGLMLAPLPFQGPIASVRVGRLDGELKLFPTHQEILESDLDLIVAGSKESVLMIEGFGAQIPEDEMADAIMYAHKAIVEICEMQDEFVKKMGAEKTVYEGPGENPFTDVIKKEGYDKLKKAKQNTSKQLRHEQGAAVREELIQKYFPEGTDVASNGGTIPQLKEAFYKCEKQVVRDLILEGKRLDGRAPDDLRGVTCSVGMLPQVHGSAVFTRGETQSMATITLGTSRDQQRTDSLFGESSARFMLHYYFPSFSVGEVRPIRGPGRREIGHGCLAERSVEPVLPPADKFPYTIRVISDILESNGSSSMASVCSATLGLMDAGVRITQPVAGISIGIVKETNEKYTLLTDIMGDEDHFGDMDFKVAGTQKGITGIQLDLKIDGINEKIIRETLVQARKARIELLKTMLSEIRRPRGEISDHAPRLEQIKINPEKIGLLIGPGGKTIRAIQEETGANLDVEESGLVTVSSSSRAAVDDAIARIEAMTEEIKVGKVYKGRVSSVKDFGAFVEIAPGKDGLCHISELSDGFVKSVSDVCKEGDHLEVKVIAVDDQNRIKLSRKALLVEANGGSDSEAEEE
ncbi:Polyribonucleotide nucleotidyltransferase [Polystyrenella longa]|uniref:Polyribonucleotide nucleotidyltransferase n=1 Tax=Polystyrenella longa TaxID=2528007 RepID=A0A518CJT1_9PLAN|nr:polyribonucleotide nucleotidyltransferase [Polystyrenella longa]QDU79486.1 Polyribonucleotide nucleotidyltransferase [Polystyrenella longa]